VRYADWIEPEPAGPFSSRVHIHDPRQTTVLDVVLPRRATKACSG